MNDFFRVQVARLEHFTEKNAEKQEHTCTLLLRVKSSGSIRRVRVNYSNVRSIIYI